MYKELIEKAKTGDEQAFEQLYNQTYVKSSYVARKYFKEDTDTANDVLQDSYVKAFSHLDQLNDPESFPGWFASIVAKTSLNELKKRKPLLFSQMDNDEDGLTFVDSLEDERIDTQPEISMDTAETQRLVREMIDTLSEEQRMCVLMYYMEDMPTKEIAKTLGVSDDVVRQRLSYSRKTIKGKVLDLEKKGTKLYGLLPFGFFLCVMKMDAAASSASPLPEIAGIIQTAVSAVQSGATTASIASAATNTAKVAKSAVKMATRVKIALGTAVTAVAVVAGAVAINSNTPKYDTDINYDGRMIFHEKLEDGVYTCLINDESKDAFDLSREVTLYVDDEAEIGLISYDDAAKDLLKEWNTVIIVPGKSFKELEFTLQERYEGALLYDLDPGFWGNVEVSDGVITYFTQGLRYMNDVSGSYDTVRSDQLHVD